MTNDLISRSELLLEMAAGCVPLDVKGISGVTGDESTIYDYIKNAPSVDAVPVVHGRWIDSKGAIRCSECLHTPLYDYHGRLKLSKACPTCGANMWKERGE